MTILVTAASGHFGRLVVESLLARGADPADVVASARDTSKLEELAARGIRTVELDYARPETIAPALDGVDTVLLVSGTEFGSRVAAAPERDRRRKGRRRRPSSSTRAPRTPPPPTS